MAFFSGGMISPGDFTGGWFALMTTSKKAPPVGGSYDSPGLKTAMSPRDIFRLAAPDRRLRSPSATITRSPQPGAVADAHGAASRVTRTYSFSSATAFD